MSTRPANPHPAAGARKPVGKSAPLRTTKARPRSGKPPVGGIIAVAVVVVVVLALIGVKVASNGGGASSADNQAVPTAVLSQLEQIPAATFDAVGRGSAGIQPVALPGPALQSGGKPELLYVGAEYCPYCAAQRWSMIVALSRFGHFSGLQLMTSAAQDVYPSTPTFTFVHASYTSPNLAFSSVEIQSNQMGANGRYAPLQTLSPQQQQLMNTFDAPPYVAQNAAGTIPFLDVANHYALNGSPFTPQVLHGETWQQIAQALQQPSNADAQAIIGGANVLTATICAADGNQPAAVCSSPAVQQIHLAGS